MLQHVHHAPILANDARQVTEPLDFAFDGAHIERQAVFHLPFQPAHLPDIGEPPEAQSHAGNGEHGQQSQPEMALDFSSHPKPLRSAGSVQRCLRQV
ncbi:hypothetical protein D9M68_828580 [compost metagenome]